MTFAVHDTRFPRAPATEPPETAPRGSWTLTYEKGRPSASCVCPICSVRLDILHSRISHSGAIDSALSCNACSWFDYVTLDGWAEANGLEVPTYGRGPE